MIPFRYAFQSNSHRFISFDNTSIFALVFPKTAAGFSAATYWVLSSNATGIGISNFLRAVFMVRLNSSSSGSIKKIPRRFDQSDICFHISGHTLSGLDFVCFLVSLPPEHENPSGGLSFNKMHLVKNVHASDNSLSPSTFQ